MKRSVIGREFLMRLETKFGWIEQNGDTLKWAFNMGEMAKATQPKGLAGKMGGLLVKGIVKAAIGDEMGNVYPLSAISNPRIDFKQSLVAGSPASLAFDVLRNGELVESGLPLDESSAEEAKLFVAKLAELTQGNNVINPEFKSCPSCAEDIKFEAKKCRFCGEAQE
jgi:hypothetical protein